MAESFIFSSKLYRAHPDKARIHAALENPINAELVQQLHEYLDDEYQNTAVAQPETEDTGSTPTVDTGSDSTGGGSAPSSGGGGSRAPSGGSFGDITFSDPGAPDDTGSDEGEGSDDAGMDSEPTSMDDIQVSDGDDEDVESATKPTGRYVKASSDIGLDSLKGLLDANEDTAGVYRIGTVDNELWIYYNDSINLNNIMTPVIELLLAAGYSQLSFNRLARTNNAIVFEILPSASESQYGVEDNDVNE